MEGHAEARRRGEIDPFNGCYPVTLRWAFPWCLSFRFQPLSARSAAPRESSAAWFRLRVWARQQQQQQLPLATDARPAAGCWDIASGGALRKSPALAGSSLRRSTVIKPWMSFAPSPSRGAGRTSRPTPGTTTTSSWIFSPNSPGRPCAGEVRRRRVGGLLGHWSWEPRRAVELLHECQRWLGGQPIPAPRLTRAAQVIDANAAGFDATNGFAGSHDVLRRQSLLEGHGCLDPKEPRSPGQAVELERVPRSYAQLNDDRFVAQHRDAWWTCPIG